MFSMSSAVHYGLIVTKLTSFVGDKELNARYRVAG